MTLSKQDIFFGKIANLRVHQDVTAQRRAVHKPLLLLCFLGRLQRGDQRFVLFEDVEETLIKALQRFGPKRKQIHAEYPFWALKNDGVCELRYKGRLKMKTNDSKPTRRSLIESRVEGGFFTEDYYLLREDRAFQGAVIHHLLDHYFPSSMHGDILAHFGLSLPVQPADSARLLNEGNLRRSTLSAYDSKCALSGFSLRIDGAPGLDVAMLCWPQVGGEYAVSNALLVTTTYRKLFDLGVLTLSDDLRVKVAKVALAEPSTCLELKALENKAISLPNNNGLKPSIKNVQWHQKEVFRG